MASVNSVTLDDEDENGYGISYGSISISGGGGQVITGIPVGSPGITFTSSSNSFTGSQVYAVSSYGNQPLVPKTSMAFVVVKDDGSCIELKEQQTMTSREMIGICKFVSLATLGTPVTIEWLALIHELGISRHFVPGKSTEEEYDDEEVFYTFLYTE